jgi:2'-5' RNA ligase
MAEQIRLFIACELPTEARAALGRVEDDLRRLGAERLRWVRPEGIHITLKFLGGVDAERVGKIEAALTATIEPFELRLAFDKLGNFGGNRARVLWIGLEGDVAGLSELAERVDNALEPLGLPRERRPFAAHITLARVPEQLPAAVRRELPGLLARYSPRPLPPMILTEVSLMRSELGPGGSRYHRLASFPKAGAGS